MSLIQQEKIWQTIPRVRFGRKNPSPQVCAENWAPMEECWWPCSPCHLSLSRWVFLYEKGYQSQDSIVSSVSVKLKGLTLTNESVLGPHIWDVVDYVFPPQVRSWDGWVRDLPLSQWLLFLMCWGADRHGLSMGLTMAGCPCGGKEVAPVTNLCPGCPWRAFGTWDPLWLRRHI